MELNPKGKRKTVINPEGSEVLERSRPIQLYLESSNIRLRADSFYKEAGEKLKTLLALGKAADQEYVLGLAKFLADKGLKLSPVILLSILSNRKFSFRDKGVEYIFNTPARIAEAISLQNIKECDIKLNNSFKKNVLKTALENMNDHTLRKNKMKRRKVKLADLIKLLRAKPKNENIAKLYKAIIENTKEASLRPEESIVSAKSSTVLKEEEKKEILDTNLEKMPINQIIRNLKFYADKYDFNKNIELQQRIVKKLNSVDNYRMLNIFDVIMAAMFVPQFEKALFEVVKRFVVETKKEFNYQDDATLLFDISGCFKGDTLISTQKGLKEIKDIEEGDLVLSSDYNKVSFKKVSKKFEYTKQNMLQIKTKTNRLLEVTPNHMFFIANPINKNKSFNLIGNVKKENVEILEIPAERIKKGDYVITPVNYNLNHKSPVFKDNRLNLTLTEDLAKLIGYLTADGHKSISLKSSSAYLALSDKNLENLEYYQKIVQSLGLSGKIKILNNGRQKLYINSKPFTEFIINNFEKCIVLSRQREVPRNISSQDNKIIIPFLRGFFDGEGTIGHHNLAFVNSSRKLLEGIKLLLERIGVKSTIYFYIMPKRTIKSKMGEISYIKETPFYTLDISGLDDIAKFNEIIGVTRSDKIKKIKNMLASQIGSSHENNKSKYYTDQLQIEKIVSVNKLGNKKIKVYDLEVEENHNYFAGGVLVHNSMSSTGFCGGLSNRDNKDGEGLGFMYLILFALLMKNLKLRTFSNELNDYKRDSKDLSKVLEKIRDGSISDAYKIFDAHFKRYSSGTALLDSATALLDEDAEINNLIVVTDEVSWEKQNLKTKIADLSKRLNDRNLIIVNPVLYEGTVFDKKVVAISGLTPNVLVDMSILLDEKGFIEYIKKYKSKNENQNKNKQNENKQSE